MNKRFQKLTPLMLASSVVLLAACSESNESFETPNADVVTNSGTISQKNLSLLAEDTQPVIFDTTAGTATDTTLEITVKIGDKSNRLLTDKHTVYFQTEWGLVDASCTTSNGTCTVNWQTSFGKGTIPADLRTTIVAYTLGEEYFSDTNGNGEFDDNDQPFPAGGLFNDIEEPYIDSDEDGVFGTGDIIIDVLNGNTLGQNGVHDLGDGFLSSPSCKHSSLCSTTLKTTYIWDDIVIKMDGP